MKGIDIRTEGESELELPSGARFEVDLHGHHEEVDSAVDDKSEPVIVEALFLIF